MIKKGTFVEIENIVLECDDRATSIPDDTKKTPLKMWVRGWVNSDCELGDKVEITTATNRKIEGIVVESEPGYSHNFGSHINDIDYISIQARKIIND